jgi:hypothetical protein
MVAAVSSVRQLTLPVGSARERTLVVSAPLQNQPENVASEPSQLAMEVPEASATLPPAPSAEPVEPSDQVTRQPATQRHAILPPIAPGIPSGTTRSTCLRGQPSTNCVAPLRTRFDRDQPKRALVAPSSADPMIVNPWAEETPAVKGRSQPSRVNTPHRFLWRTIDSPQAGTPNRKL